MGRHKQERRVCREEQGIKKKKASKDSRQKVEWGLQAEKNETATWSRKRTNEPKKRRKRKQKTWAGQKPTEESAPQDQRIFPTTSGPTTRTTIAEDDDDIESGQTEKQWWFMYEDQALDYQSYRRSPTTEHWEREREQKEALEYSCNFWVIATIKLALN